MELSGSDYHHELLHGQDFVLPSKTQWQEICAVGPLEGTPVPVRELIQNWLRSWAEFQAAQLGATKIREQWMLVPLLVLKGRYYRVHFEDVICEHCDRRCGPSATPESVSYACTGLTPAQIRAEFETLPIKACPHCGGLLRRRHTSGWLRTKPTRHHKSLRQMRLLQGRTEAVDDDGMAHYLVLVLRATISLASTRSRTLRLPFESKQRLKLKASGSGP